MAKNPLRPISPEDVQAFMQEKKVDSLCPRCKVGSWLVNENPGARGVGVYAVDDDGNIPGKGFYPLIFLQCNHCANVWFVSRMPVQEWLDARNANAAAE